MLDTEHGMPRWTCTCPDWAERGVVTHCKHIFSVEIVRSQVQPDGTTVTKTSRVTYTQDWTSYNAAQTNERDHFVTLLRDLCSGVTQPPRKPGPGRKPIPIADVLTAATMKVYMGRSGRRTMPEYRALGAQGLLDKIPSYNSVFRYVEDPGLTPILHGLVRRSATPLAGIEQDFAVDSTGISLRTFAPGYRAEKYGDEQKPKQHGWIKFHAIIGVRTNVITAVEVKHGSSADSPEFVPLVKSTKESGFKIREVSADKAYSGHANLQAVIDIGATPFVPFREGTGDGAGSPESWRKLFHFFQWHRQEFLEHYHKRSNVEATFSSIKRVIASSVRSKSPDAQINEALLVALSHNIVRLVHAMYELGIQPQFNLRMQGGE